MRKVRDILRLHYESGLSNRQIADTLRSYPIEILHILGDGSLEAHNATEGRLLKLHGLEDGEGKT